MRISDFRGQIVDRYHLTDLIGTGKYGHVYRAVDRTSDHPRTYAVKVLSKRVSKYRRDQIKAETGLHRAVNGSPHVVRLHCIIEEEQYLFLVLDLCEMDMAKAIRARTYWRNDSLIKSAFVEVVDGLIECHAQHVFHRDIKAENIMCKADGTGIKIADFGLATYHRVCRDGGCGTFHYISPECWASDETHPYDSRLMDIWSLGIVLFKMVTSRYPWDVALLSDNDYRAFMANEDHLFQTHPISEPLSVLLKWILHPVPKKRLKLPDIRERVQEIDTFYKWRPPPSAAPESTRKAAFPESDSTCVELPDKKKDKDLERRRVSEKRRGR